ncbi:MAG: ankyrin repeat domain-containing protein [Betaproteobacteria bacterium]|nr:ankyrin repeat domain-containing protein [Betaproteobacteria bacterium]
MSTKTLPQMLAGLLGGLLLSLVGSARADTCSFEEEYFKSATLAAVEQCLSEGKDVVGDPDSDYSPVYWAAKSAGPAIVSVLIEAGAATDRSDVYGNTLLHVAAGNNPDPAVIALLIASGAEINSWSRYVGTPLHLASGNNANPAIVALLIASGADVHNQDNLGWTPLHHAAANNPDPAVISHLLAAGANVNSKDSKDMVPLHAAALKNTQESVIEALIEAGAELELKTRYHQTALHLAVSGSNQTAIRVLGAAGADLDSCVGYIYGYCMRPIFYAFVTRKSKSVEALKEAGAADVGLLSKTLAYLAGAVFLVKRYFSS